MTLPNFPALKKLYGLNASLSEFHGQLNDLLCGEEYRKCVPELQGDDLAWLVDYLDKVRHCGALPHSPLKSTQILDGLNPSSPTSWKCLRELRSICGARTILPTSYMLSSNLLSISSGAVVSGNVYEGTLNCLNACAKRVRIRGYTQGGPQMETKVRYRRRRFSCSPTLTKLADLLPRGCNMETLGTPEHLTLPGCRYHSPPIHFGLDARREPAGIHQEQPRCRPTWARRCLS